MMNRLAMGIEYDGSQFHGWQNQKDVQSVQETLEKAISKVANAPIQTVCAGRTDRGVHATAQVIHFDTLAHRSERAWLLGTNTYLHKAIRVLWCCQVPSEFNARLSATGRRYRYVIYNHNIRPSLFRKQVGWYYRKLDIQKMQEAAQYWIGEHDFSSFRAADCQSKSPVRCVTEIGIKGMGDWVMVDITANAFLHHMVRNMVGVLQEIGAGKEVPHWAKEVLEARDRRAAGIMAAASGLYLVAVYYPDKYCLPKVSKPASELLFNLDI